ncbi:hypothetical protein NQ317_007228 [Molorchus minor]|uniref:Peptidylprolyl isomerase n=1 Tax=Molorchus minor TaxID=1323400 RepID=A0ABQ9J1K0_9CUCU|nr:hypothetical protein NQ317_007228 [Molorchus minor]
MSSTFIENEIATETSSVSENDNDKTIVNNEDEDKSNNDKEIEDLAKASDSAEESKDGWIDLLGNLNAMKKCYINYTCLLEDEVKVDTANNLELYLGESDTKDRTEAGIRKKGLPPTIPEDTILIYDVELVSVAPEEDVEALSVHERKVIGPSHPGALHMCGQRVNKKRERGNWWYTRGENNIAIQCYRRALDYLDEVEGGVTGALSESDNTNTRKKSSPINPKRIQCCSQVAVQLLVQFVSRGHFRKAKVYIGKNDLSAAMKCLQRAKELSPSDGEIQKEINAVAKLLEKQKVSERELARRMFNGQKRLTETMQRKLSIKISLKEQLGLWATIGATVAVGVAGIVAYRFKYA